MSTKPSSAPTLSNFRGELQTYLHSLQHTIISALEALDPNGPKFNLEHWNREDNGGYGLSGVLSSPYGSKDTVLEKAGVMVSLVTGPLTAGALAHMKSSHAIDDETLKRAGDGQQLSFFAGGISLIIHPRNPWAPTVHANYRYFEIVVEGKEDDVLAWWFGGGSDLTPTYLIHSDATHFHGTYAPILNKFSHGYYAAMKKWADEYFYLPHRKETRGVGGIFFDDLNALHHQRLDAELDGDRPTSKEAIWDLVKALSGAFVPSYLPILTANHTRKYTEEQRHWQLLRRGRYVEFNLMYDRGTKFGLMAPGGRVENILVSLPAEVRWEYQPEMGTKEDSDEAKLLAVLREPKEWV